MAKDAKLSLIERAAARLDMRTPAAPVPPPAFTVVVARRAAEASPFTETVLPAGRDGDPGAGDGSTGSAERRVRRNSPISFDPVRLRKVGLIDWAVGRARATEDFRIIKRQLLQRAVTDSDDRTVRRNLIMVTSARPREGRTFTALNLAISIAMEPDRQVLLVDACDNENSIQSIFKETTAACGWLDLMTDPGLDIGDALLATDIPRLSVMLPGGKLRHGAELLASDRMQRLLETLADRYHDRIVLIDAPPCLVSSDPAALARVVGQTILVVEANTTQQQSLEAAMELLRPCKNTYLVLNKSRFR